jgi:uncharacterized protein YcfJ
MSSPPDDAGRGRPWPPPQPNMKRELIGSVVGAVLGATIAQVLSGEKEIIVSAAIAGSFVGPGLLAFARRTWHSYTTRR